MTRRRRVRDERRSLHHVSMIWRKSEKNNHDLSHDHLNLVEFEYEESTNR